MTISDIRIRLIHRIESKLRAVASFTIDNCFAVHDIRIYEREDGFYIMMPNRKTAEGGYKDIAHPLNTETRNMLQKSILDEFFRTQTAEPQA